MRKPAMLTNSSPDGFITYLIEFFGCGTQQLDDIAFWKGILTKAVVRENFGPPNSVTTAAQDEIWSYQYFDAPIDNGIVEGLNNKAKVIIHKAYGFKTATNYIRNLYHRMADLPLPRTMHTFV